MSKELKNITDNIMSQIKEGKLKMRPKIYFIVGTILTFTSLIVSVITSIFVVSLISFSLRSHHPIGGYRMQQMISDFPWWMSVLAVLGLVVGVLLIRRYNFSYKINFKIIVVLFILSVVISGWFIDVIGINNTLSSRGPMKRVMNKYFQEHNIQPGDFR